MGRAGPAPGRFADAGRAGHGIGVAFLAWTAQHLRRAAHPLVSIAPFDEWRSFRIASVAGSMASISVQATPFLLPLLFQVGLGQGAVAA